MLTKTMAKSSKKSRPGPGEERTADRLHSLAIRMLRRLRTQDVESGTGPAQLSALSVLVFRGAMSLSELAKAEQVKPPTMTRIVRSLEEAKLARRTVLRGDARAFLVSVTAKGERVLQQGRRRRTAALAQALGTIPSRDLKRIKDSLAALERAVLRL